MAHLPISCCIITKNEADRIGACIDAVRDVADEVVVIDSGSTDDTVAVAEARGARVEFNDWNGYGPQKRYSEERARNDWILHLDADEVVTPELASEIKALTASEPPFKAYRVRIRNVYPGKSKPRLWADYHNYVRLYDRRSVRYSESAVHDTVDTRGLPVGQLRASVIHYSARSYAHIKAKLNAYTTLQSKVLRKPAWWIMIRLPFEYPAVFLRYLLARRHFTGGWDGLYTCHLAASARVGRLLKLLAAQREAREQAAEA